MENHSTENEPHLFDRLLRNETAFAIQRRLQLKGITAVILPIHIAV